MADLLSHLLKSLDFSQATEILTKFVTSLDPSARDLALVESSKAILLAFKEKGWNVGEPLVSKLLREICLPFLHDTEFTSTNKARQYLPQVHELIALCCSIYPEVFLGEIWRLISRSIAAVVEGKLSSRHEQSAASLDVSVVLDLVGFLVKCEGRGNERLFSGELEETAFVDIVKLLPHTGESLCAKLTSGVLPSFLQRRTNERVEVLWNVVQEISKDESTSGDQSTATFHKSYAILCGLADFFLSSSAEHNICRHVEFWEIIQKGVILMEPLTLKRAIFLLKKAVNSVKQQSQKMDVRDNGRDPIFRWDPGHEEEFLQVWQEYVLMIEILDEGQVHLISPVLPRIADIVAKTKKETEGVPILDVTWVMVLYRHASQHPNRFIHRWAVVSFLSLDLHNSPLLEPVHWGFLFDPLLSMLKEHSTYSRGEGAVCGDVPDVGRAVLQFFSRFVDALPEEQWSTFLCQLLSSIEKAGLEEVPLVFLTQALSEMPPWPAWDGHALASVKRILAQFYTFNLHLRGCLQYFLFKAVVRLTDTGRVRWSEMEVVLTSDQLGESLVRGSAMWMQLCDLFWRIQNHDSNTSLPDYLRTNIDSLLRDENAELAAGSPRIQALVRMLLFAADAHFTFTADSGHPLSPIIDIVQQLVSAVQQAGTHVYASGKRVLHACLLLSELLEQLDAPHAPREDPTVSVVLSIFTSGCSEILSSLVRKLTLSSVESCDLATGGAYLRLAEQIFLLIAAGSESNLCSKHLIGFWGELIEKSGAAASREALQRRDLSLGELSSIALATKCLALVCRCVMSHRGHFQGALIQFLRQTVSQLSLRGEFHKPRAARGIDDSAVPAGNWSAVVLEAIETQWACVEFLLHETLGDPREGAPPHQSPDHLLVAALDILSVAPQQATLPVLRCVGRLVPAVSRDDALVVSALDAVWRAFQDRRRRDLKWFWETLRETTAVLFSGTTLGFPRDHPVTSRIRDYWQELLACGENRPGVVNEVVARCCELWAGASGLDCAARVRSLSVHADLVVGALLFGPQFRKQLSIVNDVIGYLRCLGDEGVNGVLKYDQFRSDVQPRVDVINALMTVDPRDASHVTFLRELIRALIRKDAEMSAEWPISRLNSRSHRRKLRLWQTVLALFRRVLVADGSEELGVELLESTFLALCCRNQSSVRVLLEWTMILTLGRFPSLHQRLWQQMVHSHSKRTGSEASLITGATLVGQYGFTDPSAQATYFCSVLSTIFPWILSPHAQTRLYAQEAVQKIWSLCRESKSLESVLRQYAVLEPCMAFMRETAPNSRQKLRLAQNFFLFDVDPWGDHTVESVFQAVPQLSGVTDDEWISPAVFTQSATGERVWNTAPDPHRIPLYNPENSALAQMIRAPRRMTGVEAADRTGAQDDKGSAGIPQGGDVQQKISPWSVLPPEPEAALDQDSQRLLAQQKRAAGGLVVVASLIDRAPNLGGLCRTCEVFGARALVLGSRQVLDDVQFKSLSVSAAKWVNVEEVKPADLKTYLEDMRRQGYTLIGVEQTANSANLTRYQFPHKSLLLLGHEKEGIPVQFIHLLDQCVEIPQLGVIRSLNVHVSGALLIWEYTRQRLLSKDASAGPGTAGH